MRNIILDQKLNMICYAKDTASSGNLMRITPESINQIISELQTTANEVDTLVRTISSESINRINSSWVAGEAKTYVDKVELANTKIAKVNDGLKILAATFDSALKNMTSTSQNVSNDVNNI